ncbi:carbohydrate ABC transporter permease [Nonomuraea ferruginea]
MLIVSFAVAMLLNQRVRGLSVWRTIFYLPTLVPAIANVVLWIWIFNPDFGLLNSLLRQGGLPTSQWIYAESTAVPSLIIMSTWAFGNTMVIFLAGLQGVPRHLYEAVSIDGGGPLRRFWHVTLPMMTPTIFYNLVVGVVGTFQVFNQAYVMTEGGPNHATLFYVYYLFRKAFNESEMGYASALAWTLFHDHHGGDVPPVQERAPLGLLRDGRRPVTRGPRRLLLYLALLALAPYRRCSRSCGWCAARSCGTPRCSSPRRSGSPRRSSGRTSARRSPPSLSAATSSTRWSSPSSAWSARC